MVLCDSFILFYYIICTFILFSNNKCWVIRYVIRYVAMQNKTVPTTCKSEVLQKNPVISFLMEL